ncbi:actin filament-associated protein 1-like 2 [Lepisosteus oculatus]|uniref:actin filament-associated protein 1-like 2 n=1 Tax=Lepisosteus oculatus TaxID=7918 RepID=UPI0035F51352
MNPQKELSQLISDLQSFLLVLDRENLSYIAQAKKKSISDLLSRMQDTPVEDAEYMVMNCPTGAARAELQETGESGQCQAPSSSSSLTQWPLKWSDVAALPSDPPDDPDDGCYEEAEPFFPSGPATEGVDSDSSHYESYGEEEEEEEEEDSVKDRAHYIQWRSSQPCLRPAPESRICGYLWRKRWLGQWTRQLFVIRNHLLLCYKCAKDLQPLLELCLQGCHAVYKSKLNKKIQHELKVVTSVETVVLGFPSRQQAEEWRKIIEEVSGSSYGERESHSSSSLLRSDRLDSCWSSEVLHTDSEEEKLSGAPSAHSCLELKDKGFLNVLMNCQWQSLWCHVQDGALKMYRDEACEDSPQYCVQLLGSEVRPGPDTAQGYRITVSQQGVDVAVLEASCADDKERWLQLLQDGRRTQSEPSPVYEHLDLPLPGQPSSSLRGLLDRRFPAPNTYIDDPFRQLRGAGHTHPVYANADALAHTVQDSQNASQGDVVPTKDMSTYSNSELFACHIRKSRKAAAELEQEIQRLELASRTRAQLKAGSEMNLLGVGKAAKRTPFRQSLALGGDSPASQGGFFTPLLRRTASAKNTLRRVPSAFFLEKGKALHKRKEWETKASV